MTDLARGVIAFREEAADIAVVTSVARGWVQASSARFTPAVWRHRANVTVAAPLDARAVGGLIEINADTAPRSPGCTIAATEVKPLMTYRGRIQSTGLVFCAILLLTATGVGLRLPISAWAATPTAAMAQDAGDVSAGRHLAQTWCSSCHVVDPVSQRRVDNGAPAFTAVAAMSSTTPMALRAFLQTPHAKMPDLHLSRNEIDDLTAYILSLRQK